MPIYVNLALKIHNVFHLIQLESNLNLLKLKFQWGLCVCVSAWYMCGYVCIYEIRKIFALNLKGKTRRLLLPGLGLSRVYFSLYTTRAYIIHI